jgi:hypothetical protein
MHDGSLRERFEGLEVSDHAWVRLGSGYKTG